MIEFPTGTVTFLFTDIEDSTRLWQERSEAMTSSHARHDEILHEAIASNQGYVFQIVGDSFSAAFHNAGDALHTAVKAQRALTRMNANPSDKDSSFTTHAERSSLSLKVRMGLHTGTAELLNDGSGKYDGYVTLATAQRVMSVAHGGQILLSQTTHDLLQNNSPEDISLRDVGEHRLKGLRTPLRLYQVLAPELQQEFPAIHSLEAFPNNLPAQLTSFIGREKEIDEIKSLLHHGARLVTLTGSGGTGKTRLSQELGTQELTNFPHGVWLIELAPLTDPAQIIPALAQVFGLQELPFRPLASLVMDYLRDKKSLLILDNCEHLIQACARLADDLLHQCTGLKILASSREALGIAGEMSYHVPSLAESESTQLFVDRARAVNPNFKLTNGNASSIAQICSRLDGIPLAIELAAARVKLLSPEQIAARLDDMFRLLVGGSRTALPRQQTLRALIDWSYDLLSDEEKHLLQFASVFLGGWTLDALEAVADSPNTLELLEHLVNKSLVVTEERGIEMRYFLLETIRQYAREKLFEAKQASAARDRHFTYFDNLSESMWNAFRSANDQLAWRDKVDDELENLRAALEWGLENNIEDAVHLAANFCVVSGWISNIREGLPLVELAVERVKSLPPAEGDAHIHRQKLIARALFALGMVGMGSGIESVRALQEAITIARLTGDRLMLGYSLEMYFTAGRFNNAPGALEAAQEGLIIFTDEINDHWGLGMAYQNMVSVAAQKGDLSAKEEYFRKLKELMREVPTSFQAGIFFLGIGLDESVRGNYETARPIFENGLNIFRHLRNRNFQTICASELGHIARHTGDMNQANKIYTETLKSWQDLGNRAAIAHQLECFAFIAIADEGPQRAIKLFSAAEALRERIQSQMTYEEQVEYDQAVAQVRSMLAEAEFIALWAEGRAMTMEQAIQIALDSKPTMRD
jgi:predicted ATPase/class 3 adenylate cyclase